MLVSRLRGTELTPANARPKKIGDKLYHEIRCGDYVKGAWCMPIGLARGIVDEAATRVTLDKDEYAIIPVNNGKAKTDNEGNRFYFLGRDYENRTVGEHLIFWDMPFHNDSVENYIEGEATVLARCRLGRVTDGVTTTREALLVHVHGKAILGTVITHGDITDRLTTVFRNGAVSHTKNGENV